MNKTTRRSRAGFTLIELLTVIAIIGILAAILFPAIGAAKKAAQKANDLSNIRSLGQAALIYSSDNNDRLPDPKSTSNTITGANLYMRWFAMLAKAGNLSDPSVCYSKLDTYYPADPITSIVDPSDTTKNTITPLFLASFPSYEVVGGLKASDPSSTPIVFTRGLLATGLWDPTNGVYGTDGGGMVVFVGGNVSQYKTIGTPSKLIQTNGNTTINVAQAVPNSGNVAIYGSAGKAGTGTESGTAPVAAGSAN
ncbi:MAG: prepilin-type N-terminal cleavage/methylation domain-containing protein [Opitutaceae bacterium]|jgi:prepilin-type N-terminal cleavage/methylation domain-containing protein